MSVSMVLRRLDENMRASRELPIKGNPLYEPLQYETLRQAIGELCGGAGGKLPSVQSLGTKLSKLRGRVVGGQAMEASLSNGTNMWKVVKARCPKLPVSGPSGPSGPVSGQYARGNENHSEEINNSAQPGNNYSAYESNSYYGQGG
jgi:hypothetical protein